MTAASAPGERPAASTGWGTTARQGGYGAAAVVGLVGTGWFNLSYAAGDQAQGYLQAWFANAASSSAA
ncbi:MAG TPA: hypothetical protein VHN80_31190, partial [Kineosporiaceae bacterium]|nr:hypothetical protein [Kineosporiaceae bacterium]